MGAVLAPLIESISPFTTHASTCIYIYKDRYVVENFRLPSDFVKDKVSQVFVISCELLTLFTFGFICCIISLSVCNFSKDMRNFRPKHVHKQAHNFMSSWDKTMSATINLLLSQTHRFCGTHSQSMWLIKDQTQLYWFLFWHSHARNSHCNAFVIVISSELCCIPIWVPWYVPFWHLLTCLLWPFSSPSLHFNHRHLQFVAQLSCCLHLRGITFPLRGY